MRVVMICPEFPPHSIGGGGEVFRALSEAVSRCGVELDVIAGNLDGGDRQWESAGVRYAEIPLLATPAATPFLRTVMPPTRSGFRKLRALIAAGSYDVAHVHGVSFVMVDVAAHLLQRHGVPWVFTLHGQPRTPYRVGFPLSAAYAAYLRAYGRFVVRRAAVRTTVSAATSRFPSIARDMSDARVIPNGVDAEAFSSDLPERAIPGWPAETRNVVLSVGRLTYGKGFDIGLRALASMRTTDAVYVLLGDDAGELRRLREIAGDLALSNRFLTLGQVTREQVRFALRRASVVWVPSRWEAFGLVPLEAMAAGVPVIASGSEGLRETFADGLEELVMASPDDAVDLAAKTDRILGDGAERRRISGIVRERAKAFDWSVIAGRYVECYRSATGQ
jgi:phosphatidylinositol alpha-mannosyltransferase